MVRQMVMGRRESGSRKDKALEVKMEIEDEHAHAPLHKRPRQQDEGICGFTVSPSDCNFLDEPSPLGLRLRKSPSLLEIIQMKLSQGSTSQSNSKNELKSVVASGDKLKASNFPGSLLRIGNWEYKSRYEGDLVAKFYFAKHKLVWEFLDGGLKNKIEIQWSDILALKANYHDHGPGTLDVVLARQPLFFRETNPQPRKHTLWQTTSDFTGGDASTHRQHYLECPHDLLGKHFEKLVQCDPHLSFLSQQREIALDSPYFEPKVQLCDDAQNGCNSELDLSRETSHSFFSFLDNAASPFLRSKNDAESLVRSSESFTHETLSPSSGRRTLSLEDIKSCEFEQLKEVTNWDRITAPGLRSSMSEFVSNFEHQMSEQGTSSSQNLEWESLKFFDDINRSLFNGHP